MNYSDRESALCERELDILLADLNFSQTKKEEDRSARLRAELDLIGAPADDVMKPAIVDLDSAGPIGLAVPAIMDECASPEPSLTQKVASRW